MDETTTVTRELYELCKSLRSINTKSKDEAAMLTLMHYFSVENHSEFYEIFSCIFERIHSVRQQLKELSLDEAIVANLNSSLNAIDTALSPQMMSRPWDRGGATSLDDGKINALLLISPFLQNSYPLAKIDDESAKAILEEAENLRDFIQLKYLTDENPFQALMLDGLDKFIFRIKRLKWVGANYSLLAFNLFMSGAVGFVQNEPDTQNPEILAKIKSLWEKVSPFTNAAYKSYGYAKLITTATHLLAGS